MPEQPAGVPPFTVVMMAAEAAGALEQWLDDYTEPSDEEYAAGHQQRRIRTHRAVPVNGVPGSFTMDTTVRGEGEPEQRYQLTVTVQLIPPPVPQIWRLEGYDTFEGEYYPLGNLKDDPYMPQYNSYKVALHDARRRLAELGKTQAGAGDIQDQVFIVHPGGRKERVQ